MILAFYKVDNSKKYERHTFDNYRPETIKEMLDELDDDEVHFFDTEHYGWGAEPSPNLADFEEMYNDEELDEGWWCIVINLKSDKT